MPKLSIITVNLNNAKGLERTIQSVLNQTTKDYEYIVVDGGSSDLSIVVLNKYSLNLTFWVSEKDNGIYSAMNKGILKSSGEYCLFLNSGDYLINQNILKYLFSLNLSEDIISGAVISYSSQNKQRSVLSKISSSEITFSDLFEASLNHQATFLKRSLFMKYGLYDERFRIISDWIFTIKTIILNNVSYRYLDVVISAYNVDGKSGLVSYYFENENLVALNELIPDRILCDYKSGYLQYVKRMKKYWLFWTIFRILNHCTIRYASFSDKIKSFLYIKRLSSDK